MTAARGNRALLAGDQLILNTASAARTSARPSMPTSSCPTPGDRLAEPSIAKFVTGVPRKIIFVPGRLLNIVA